MAGFEPVDSPAPGSTDETRGIAAIASRDGADYSSRHGADLRQAILLDLRRQGPSTTEDIGARLAVGRATVLQQLRALESSGLVARQSVRHGVGRPRHQYDVTADAQGLLPTNYDALAAGMVEAIEAVGGTELLGRVFEARRSEARERVAARLAARLPVGADLLDRVRELAQIQDEQGYLCHASLLADGSIRLAEFNCAIHHVAVGHPAACGTELDLFRDVLGAEVVRESHIMAGDRSCSYRISEPPLND
ncbi:MAG TPA: helix-turn-helix domain-containing protein [Candidatus Acidoferrum sp.]|nr:helix-turn-helix domain-containing protein [Candidatus Acidoferrum sp.]